MKVYVDGVLVPAGPAYSGATWAKVDGRWRHLVIVHEPTPPAPVQPEGVVVFDRALSAGEIAERFDA